jgi:hypothetical protein
MWYNIAFVLIVFIALFIGFTGYSIAKENTSDKGAFEQLSRTDYAVKLGKLTEVPPEFNPDVGAMCYDMGPPNDRIDIICPDCGSSTLYPTPYEYVFDKIKDYRNIVKKITKIDVKLDETQFCITCGQNLKTKPQACLIVKYGKKAKEHKSCNLSTENLNILYEYSEGMKEHTTPSGEVVPMKKYKKLLKEMLGANPQ